MYRLYTLWVVPDGEVKLKLGQVIKDLAGKYGGPLFEPHMTFVNNISIPEEEIMKKAEGLLSEIKPFPLTLGEISFSTTYFQSVFVRIKSTGALMDAHMKIKEGLNIENYMYMPHMSLLYGNHPMQQREEICSAITKLSGLTFRAEKVILTPDLPNPSDWRHLAEFTLS